MLQNPWIPRRPDDGGPRPHPKQALYLLHDEVREVLYGGAGGGGKTDALLMGALQYVHVPDYSALIIMRTYKDLTLRRAGASRARDWLSGTAARWDRETTTWTFPSGATLAFGYLDHEGAEERYRTAEFNYVAFDELTRFLEGQYTFLFSRLRRLAGQGVPARMRAATNPGGRGHEWVRKRFVPDEYLRLKGEERFGRVWWTEDDRGRRLFVPARRHDNPSLDQADYDLSLAQLLPVVRAQLDEGDWAAHEGGHFQPGWWKSYRDLGDAYLVERSGELAYRNRCVVVAACDPAGGITESADYTAIVVAAITPGGSILILDVIRDRLGVEGVVPKLAEVCLQWRPLWVAIEDGFAQSAYVREAQRTHGIPTIERCDPGRMGSKLVRATPMILRGKDGHVHLPEAARRWKQDFVAEVQAFTGDETRDAHDDQVDALAWLIIAIDRRGVGRDEFPVVLGPGRRR